MAKESTKTWEDVADAIRAHPFHQMQLVDREKFHTGLLAYVLQHEKIGRSVYKGLTGAELPEKYVCECERESIDLVVRSESGDDSKKGEWCAVVEMKLKTGLHGQQLIKCRDKALENSSGHRPMMLLISMFPPVDLEEVERVDFHHYGLVDGVLAALKSNRLKLSSSDGDVLIRLWIDYLDDLRVLRAHHKGLNGRPADKAFRVLLGDLKLKGIFERARMTPTLLELIKAFEVPEMKGESMNSPQRRVRVTNTHGNPLVEVVSSPGEVPELGLQWQAKSLKLFIAYPKGSVPKNDEGRVDALRRLTRLLEDRTGNAFAWADRLYEQNPRKGAGFRSIKIMEWDPWGDVRNRPEQFVELANELFCDEASKIVAKLPKAG